MTIIEFLGAAALGSLFGGWLMAWVIKRGMQSDAFADVFATELRKAFRAGFLTAADLVTIEGEEELAGKLRHAAAAAAANDNN